MKTTWKEYLLAVVSIIALIVERAHFHGWNLPLTSSLNWSIAIIMLLGLAGFYLGFVVDEKMRDSIVWSSVTYVSTVLAAALSALGAITADADYLVLLTILVVAYSIAMLVSHLMTRSNNILSGTH